MADEKLHKPSSSEADERINRRAERRERLEQLSGFNRLTRRQQDIIIGSMYMQDLSDRGKRSGGFVRAGKFQESWWCHQIIRNLEMERPIDTQEINTRLPPEFFDANYESGDAEDYIQRVKECGYPCVVLFRQDVEKGLTARVQPTLQGTAPIHSLLVTGELKNGEVQVWHKDSREPFQTGGLHEVINHFAEYCADRGYRLSVGIRKVHCLTSAAHPDGVIEPDTLLP